jgi:hypothetical protein
VKICRAYTEVCCFGEDWVCSEGSIIVIIIIIIITTIVLLTHVALVLRPICFTPFWFNSPCQYTQLLNLGPPIFGVTPFSWLRSITLTSAYSLISYGNIIFCLCLFNLRPLF